MGYGSKHILFSPRGTQRISRNPHLLGNGLPKRRFDASDVALDVVRDMRDNDKIVQAYRCYVCAGFHVGRPRRVEAIPDRDIALLTELGQRANAHLRVQNRGPQRQFEAIKRLCRVAWMKRLTS